MLCLFVHLLDSCQKAMLPYQLLHATEALGPHQHNVFLIRDMNEHFVEFLTW